MKRIMNPTFKAENIDEVNVHKIKGDPSQFFILGQNYPNPVRSTTSIRYTLPNSGKVKLSVYNLVGKEVKTLVNDVKTSGVHSVP